MELPNNTHTSPGVYTNILESRRKVHPKQKDVSDNNTPIMPYNIDINTEKEKIGGYLTFRAVQANSHVGLEKLCSLQLMWYSLDKENWNELTTETDIILRNIGDEVYVIGKLFGDVLSPSDCNQFKTSGKLEVYGKCNYLWDYRSLNSKLFIRCGQNTFQNCTAIISAPELPSTELSELCYQLMFNGCTNLIKAPELPATKLTKNCYYAMFANCTSLIKAPELPAMQIAEKCYANMFQSCTSLTTAPELPATELADECYSYMFYKCTNLVTAPSILPAINLTYRCYNLMFSDCTSLVTAPELPATNLVDSCYRAMFQSCSSLKNAPEILPALTLIPGAYEKPIKKESETNKYVYNGAGCYEWMFYGCSSLTKAPVLPAEILVAGCYALMFCNCYSLSEIVCLANNIQINDIDDYTKKNAATLGMVNNYPNQTNITIKVPPGGVKQQWLECDTSFTVIDSNHVVEMTDAEYNDILYRYSLVRR